MEANIVVQFQIYILVTKHMEAKNLLKIGKMSNIQIVNLYSYAPLIFSKISNHPVFFANFVIGLYVKLSYNEASIVQSTVLQGIRSLELKHF